MLCALNVLFHVLYSAILTSEAYAYISALFLDDVIFFIVGIFNRSLIEILACDFILTNDFRKFSHFIK
jgi:hypothetical protein